MSLEQDIKRLLDIMEEAKPGFVSDLRRDFFPKTFQVTIVINTPDFVDEERLKKVIESRLALSEVLKIEEVKLPEGE